MHSLVFSLLQLLFDIYRNTEFPLQPERSNIPLNRNCVNKYVFFFHEMRAADAAAVSRLLVSIPMHDCWRSHSAVVIVFIFSPPSIRLQ